VRLLASASEVVPSKPGCDADHSEHDSTCEHDATHNPERLGEVPGAAPGPAVAGESDYGRERPDQSHPAPIIEGVTIPPPRRRKGGGGKKRREPLSPVVKEDTLSLVGRVVETFPSSTFKVELENGHTILASLAGRLRRFRIRITPGDDVDVELSPYDLTRGRITYRRQGRNA
jgi:translation initiation factor IF-1